MPRRLTPFLVGLMLLASGCASTRQLHVPLEPKSNDCQIVEARPSALATVAYAACWGKDTNMPVAVVGGQGIPAGRAMLDAGTAVSIAGGGVFIGSRLPSLSPKINLPKAP